MLVLFVACVAWVVWIEMTNAPWSTRRIRQEAWAASFAWQEQCEAMGGLYSKKHAGGLFGKTNDLCDFPLVSP